MRPYPLDPYLNLTHWPVSWGQLTKVSIKFPVHLFPSLIIFKFPSQEGKERHFKLGQLNRERYGDFLSETYNPDEIYVRSSDVDRTLMSAECHLAGLFQPNDNQTWHPDLAWQPIPVHTIAKEQGQFEYKSREIEKILSIFLSFKICCWYWNRSALVMTSSSPSSTLHQTFANA